MSYDLFFKKSKHNWSRGGNSSVPADAANITPKAIAKTQVQIAEMEKIKKAADGGDKKAKRKWGRMSKKLVKLQKRAAKGDPRAIKALALLGPTGLVASAALTASRGDDSGAFPTEILSGCFGDGNEPWDLEEIVGKDEILGAFVGDEERAASEENKPHYIWSKRKTLSPEEKAERDRKLLIAAKLIAAAPTLSPEELARKRAERDRKLPIEKKVSPDLLGAFVGDEERAAGEECGSRNGPRSFGGIFQNLQRAAKRARFNKFLAIRRDALNNKQISRENLRQLVRLHPQPGLFSSKVPAWLRSNGITVVDGDMGFNSHLQYIRG